MLFLMGPRQVGKTTTSREIARTRRVSRYLNWDNVDHQVPIVAGTSGLAEVLASAARLGYARSAAFGERRWRSATMLKRPFRWIALFVCTTSCSQSVGSRV